MYLADHARRVHLLLRSGELRKNMSSYLAGRIEKAANVEVRTHTEGRTDEKGFVLTGRAAGDGRARGLDRDVFSLETSLPGVLAAGDVRAESVKRVASAVGEGSMAVQYVHRVVEEGGSRDGEMLPHATLRADVWLFHPLDGWIVASVVDGGHLIDELIEGQATR